MIQTENKDYLKDPRSGALINKNKEAYEQYKLTKKNLQSAQQTRSEINSLKNEVQELKEIVKVLLDRIQ
jgi:cell shape-determining protein MreC